ncbi:hypothetical protein ACTXJY_00155 [Corynebacterium casei]|uniref:hypothetical protein n=1 Tax=Corynebacterium casei TaxID=160386 RepID=UPI003FD1B5A6
METIIAALISVLAPAFIVPFGVLNREKRDLKLRNAAEELGMDFEVWKIDKRRRERIFARVHRTKVTILTQTLTRIAIFLLLIGYVIFWSDILWRFIKRVDEIQSLVFPLFVASISIGLISLVIGKVDLELVRRKARALDKDTAETPTVEVKGI